MLSGFDPLPTGWTKQALEPVYAWNNTINGQTSIIVATSAVMVEGRDFFNAPKPNYTPFTYPHPLVTGQSTTTPTVPTSPGNLRIVPPGS